MKQVRKKDLMGALPILATMLGDKFGVKVKVGGWGPKTDGKTIYLPDVDSNDPDMVTLAIGHLDHEAAHVRYTDFDVQAASPVEHRMTGILEDYRIEKLLGNHFPGARKNLMESADCMIRKGIARSVDKNSPPPEIFGTYALYEVLARLYGTERIVQMRNQAEEALRQAFPEGVCTRLAGLLDQVDQMADTADANQLAKRILAMLKDEQQKQQQQKQQQGDDESNEADGDDGNTTDQGQQQGDDESDDADGDDGNTTDQGQQQGDDEANEADGDDGETSSQSLGAGTEGTDQDPYEVAIQQVLDAAESDLPQDLGDALRDALQTASYQSSSIRMAAAQDRKVAGRESSLLAETSGTTAQLRARLANLVQAESWNRLETRRTGRSLDTRRLHRVCVGDDRVFQKRNSQIAPNTAVQILLDRSGSMGARTIQNGPSRIEVGLRAVLASAMAMESIPGAAVQTAAFPYGSLDVLMLTPFGQSVQQTSAAYQIGVDGGTPLAEAMLWAGYELLKRKEPRKILLVATDGDPDNVDAVRDLVDRFQGSGIEVYALGIQSALGARLFPNHRVVQNLPDIPAAMIGMLQEALLKKAA